MRIDRKRQRGAVMITALMILLLMTIFGISTMDTNILEEKMAGNMRDRNTAFQAAESALRAAEIWIAAQTSMPDVRDISQQFRYQSAVGTDIARRAISHYYQQHALVG